MIIVTAPIGVELRWTERAQEWRGRDTGVGDPEHLKDVVAAFTALELSFRPDTTAGLTSEVLIGAIRACQRLGWPAPRDTQAERHVPDRVY